MASRGFLIRFIDIGLIVLFGFLMISDIQMSSRVDLAGMSQDQEEPLPEEESRAFLVVEVTAGGGYRITDSRVVGLQAATDSATSAPTDSTADATPDSTSAETAAPLLAPERFATSVPELTDALRQGRAVHRTAGLQTIVLIQPDPASLVQFTVDVMDVCDRLGLPKSLRMDIVVEAAPPAGEGP